MHFRWLKVLSHLFRFDPDKVKAIQNFLISNLKRYRKLENIENIGKQNQVS